MTDADLVERVLGTIDLPRFDAIAREHASSGFAKYLDLPKWLARNLRRVQRAGLDTGHRRRVLDLGCGCGYFLYLCKLLGHDVLGIDVPDEPMYRPIVELLGIPVIYARIRPLEPLPAVGKVDVLTAHMVCFNGHWTSNLWGPKEWRFLLDDVDAPEAFLELNREPDGDLYTKALREFFESRGGEITGHRVAIRTSRAARGSRVSGKR